MVLVAPVASTPMPKEGPVPDTVTLPLVVVMLKLPPDWECTPYASLPEPEMDTLPPLVLMLVLASEVKVP